MYLKERVAVCQQDEVWTDKAKGTKARRLERLLWHIQGYFAKWLELLKERVGAAAPREVPAVRCTDPGGPHH